MYKKYTQGITLIELLAVMVIILIIAGMFVGVSGPASQSAKNRKAEVMISALEVAIGMYKADTGGYPATDTGSGGYLNLYDELVNGTAFSGTSPWRGPYMEFKQDDITTTGARIKDPWGTPYNYDPKTTNPAHNPTNNTNSFDLWSSGKDKATSTVDEKKDDRNNW